MPKTNPIKNKNGKRAKGACNKPPCIFAVFFSDYFRLCVLSHFVKTDCCGAVILEVVNVGAACCKILLV